MLALRRWAVRNARLLERLSPPLERLILSLRPLVARLGAARLEKPFTFVERSFKGPLFDCRMCGRCILPASGYACPGNCPKGLRNGPCGGVRADGGCEITPEMRCVWVEAWDGSARMADGAAIRAIQPPVDHAAAGSSAWLRLLAEPKPLAEAPPATTAPAVGAFAAALAQGRLLFTAEMSPPDSADPADTLRRAEPLRGLVAAINVTDASGANCHISSLAVSALLVREGLTPVMQIACRDRNRIAIQGDLLGAAALGIENVLCLTGDAVQSGDHPEAKPVFDFDGVSLLKAARDLRDDGRFLSGRHIAKPPALFLGAVENPFAPPFDVRVARLAKKVAAGAQFIQTQYCFDVPLLAHFMEQVRAQGLDRRCAILVGVGPLPSARVARWLRTRVAGVHIPDTVIARLEAAKDPREEGRRICLEMMQRIAAVPGVAGIHLMAHRNEALLAELIRESGLR